MSVETTNANEPAATESAPPVVVSRSWADIAFGIMSTLVAAAIGAYIGRQIGSWGDRPEETFRGEFKPGGNAAATVFSAIMAVFSGSIAAHANLMNPAKLQEKKTSVTIAKSEAVKQRIKPILGEGDMSQPDAMIAGAVLHEGQMQAPSATKTIGA